MSHLSGQAVPVIDEITEAQQAMIDEFKQHIDRRLLELMDSSSYPNEASRSASSKVAVTKKYTIPIFFNSLENEEVVHYLEINSKISVQYVLDRIFNLISDVVTSFAYLEEWMLQNRKDRKNLIVREVSTLIPAHYIFYPESEWEVILLEKPYHPEQSKDVTRWYDIFPRDLD